MNKCSSCSHHYLLDLLSIKEKLIKCVQIALFLKLKKRRKLENNETETTIETIPSHTLCDYVAKLISNTENTNKISFEICIDLIDDMFLMPIFIDLKSIVRLIIDKIE